MATTVRTSSEDIVFGRRLDPEYAAMFELDLERMDRSARILDVAAGVASFAAEMAALGFDDVHAADPLYALAPGRIEQLAHRSLEQWLENFLAPDRSYRQRPEMAAPFDYDQPMPELATPLKMVELRKRALQDFGEHFRLASGEKYHSAALPELDSLQRFRGYFDLIVCANFLLANTGDDLNFVERSICGMARLLREGGEIRLFPAGSAFVTARITLTTGLASHGLTLQEKSCSYRLATGWNAYYSITAQDRPLRTPKTEP